MPCAALIVVSSLLLVPPQSATDCPDVDRCRQAALEAAANGDFERFHDLAWRAAQKGRPNDPDLMYLLARAQSLSGRPGDALVMLRRLAQQGVVTDARESEDFARVRALSGWAELEELMASIPARAPADPDLPRAPGKPDASPAKPAASAAKPAAAPDQPVAPPDTPVASPDKPASRGARSDAKAKPATPPPTPDPPPPPDKAAGAAPAVAGGEETMGLPGDGLEPIGLAYDSASRRFVVGDRHANKLMVADDVFKRVNDLIGARSGGFGTLSGVEIDARRGDLWVSSYGSDGRSLLHKLQLVSGRVLSTIELPDDATATFTDVVMTQSGLLLLADSSGKRIWSVGNGGSGFGKPIQLEVDNPTSLAAAGDIVYVAHDEGLSIVDLRTRRVSPVSKTKGVDLGGLKRVRASRGSLVAIQGEPESGTGRLVRIRLRNSGRTAHRVEALDGEFASDGSALTISRDSAYYVARTPDGHAIRRVELK